jgi:hypothetical protein
MTLTTDNATAPVQQRYCISCKHSRMDGYRFRMCTAGPVLKVDLVDGPQPAMCEGARKPDGPCGPDGILFVSRQTVSAGEQRVSDPV